MFRDLWHCCLLISNTVYLMVDSAYRGCCFGSSRVVTGIASINKCKIELNQPAPPAAQKSHGIYIHNRVQKNLWHPPLSLAPPEIPLSDWQPQISPLIFSCRAKYTAPLPAPSCDRAHTLPFATVFHSLQATTPYDSAKLIPPRPVINPLPRAKNTAPLPAATHERTDFRIPSRPFFTALPRAKHAAPLPAASTRARAHTHADTHNSGSLRDPFSLP